MKVIVIYDEIPEDSYWFEADESWIKFQGVYINRVAPDAEAERLQSELSDLIYDDDGKDKVLMSDFHEPLVFNEPVTIVRCGFLL